MQEGRLARNAAACLARKRLRRHRSRRSAWSLEADYLTETSLISNTTATFGGNGVRGSAP